MKRLSKSFIIDNPFCLIIFAVVLSGFRYFLPRLDNYRPEIETYLSKQFNSPVTMTQVKRGMAKLLVLISKLLGCILIITVLK